MRFFVKWNLVILALVVFGTVGATVALADNAAFTPTDIIQTDLVGFGTANLGMVFTTDANDTVTALGFYDQPGLTTAPEMVGLYDSSGNLLASVLVPVTDNTPVAGYLWASITPVALRPGGTYTVDAYFGDNPWAYGDVSTSPLITFDYDNYTFTNGLAFPNTTGGAGPAYLGPNMEVVDPPPVPESSTLGLLAIGLVLTGFLYNRKMLASAADGSHS